MALFNLEEEKTPAQLSAGMKIKYSLTLALSHGVQLLILDEPNPRPGPHFKGRSATYLDES